jgi:hypothetical protein
MRKAIAATAVATALLAAPMALRAEEARRIGVLVGNNRGPADRPPLRYADDDASELAAVLTDLGGFRHDDVYVLREQPLPVVRSTIAAVRRKILAARASSRRVVLLFYFSGHSDGQALELGEERWEFADVRRALQELGADVRIAIIDSCKSGALLAEKGAAPGPTFDIRFTDDLATSGEAVLTSSAAHEAALESGEIRSSFFSHHFISGLRGAADASGDGRVTLGEAYRYAFVSTLVATSNTLSGPQHPEYDYRLTGRGELVLTDLVARGAKLWLPEGFDQLLIADQGRGRLVAELGNTSARRLALPAGRYLVQGRRKGRVFEASVDLQEGARRELAAADLAPTRVAGGTAKGGDPNDLTVAGLKPPPTQGLLSEVERLVSDGNVERACSIVEATIGAGEVPSLQRFLGRCYMRLGLVTKARASYRRYLELAPDAPDAAFVRGIVP